MQIALGISRNKLIVIKEESGFGSVVRGKAFSLTTMFGLNEDPLNVMRSNHGMGDRTDFNDDAVAITRNDGNVFFTAGFNGSRHEFFHFLAATIKWVA